VESYFENEGYLFGGEKNCPEQRGSVHLLLCFELLSGMEINFHNNEVIVMGAEAEEHTRVARLLNCKQDKFPFIYLGFTMSDHKLTIAE
jgi:hypothetical protein